MDSPQSLTDLDIFDVRPLRDRTSNCSIHHSSLSSDYLLRISAFNCINSRIHANDLPVDILVDTFMLVPSRFNEHPQQWDSAIQILSEVCHHWRYIVHSQPRFYSAIYVDHNVPIARLERIIARSKATRLTVAINISLPSSVERRVRKIVFSRTSEAFRVLTPVMGRCIRVYLGASDAQFTRMLLAFLSSLDGSAIRFACVMLRPSAPVWQRSPAHTSHLDYPILFSDAMPALRRLHLGSMFVNWQFSSFWCNLTYLRLDHLCYSSSPTADELLHMLHSTPFLERLHLDRVECADVSSVTAPTPTLHSLTHLYLCAVSAVSSDILPFLKFPILHSVYLELTTTAALEGVFRGFVGLGGGVRFLVTNLPLIGVQAFLQLARIFPNVEQIDARGLSPFGYPVLHAIAVQWPGRFAALRRIWLDDYVEPEVLATLLRGLTGESAARLRIGVLCERSEDAIPVFAFFDDSDTIQYETCVTSSNLFDF